MKSTRLDSLDKHGVAFDLETHLFQPGLMCPPIVAGSVAHGWPSPRTTLLAPAELLDFFLQMARSPDAVMVGANNPYDILCEMAYAGSLGLDVAPDVFNMFDPARTVVAGECDGRVLDVQMAEKLHAVGRGHLGMDPRTGRKLIDPETGKQGRYSLAITTDLVLGRTNAKANAGWRKSFALLDGVHPRNFPPDARAYMQDDAANPLEVALAQVGLIDNIGPHDFKTLDGHPNAPVVCKQCGKPPGVVASCRSRFRRLNTHEIARQCYADFCLKAGAAWGFAVDHVLVDDIEREYDESHDGKLQPFIDLGMVRPNGSRNESVIKKFVAAAFIAGTEKAPTACVDCLGAGKVPSPKTKGKTKINCKACDGSGLSLPPEVPRTPSGEIAIGADVLNESGHETLINLADYDKDQKIKNDYIPFFRQRDKKTGQEYRGVPLTLRPNGLLENGRVSYDGKIMMLPRHGRIRGVLCARLGRVLSSQDYEGSELVGHAQSCLWIVGASRLAEALNSGLNAHLALACQILGSSYEEAQRRYKSKEQLIIDIRQVCKPPNFGFPGRMGAAALVKQQRKQNDVHTPHPNGPSWIPDPNNPRKLIRGFKGLRFCLFMKRADYCGIVKVTEWKGRQYSPLCKKCIECAEDLKKSWITTWPENVPYFAHVKAVDESGLPVMQHVSKRLRGFQHGQVDDNGEPINSGNAIANTYFSAIIADAAKNALCAITRECYDRTVRVRSFTSYTSRYEGLDSPLFGTRIPVFQHDETIGDHPASVAADAATRQAELMEESLRIMCPDMHKAVKVQPTLMYRWDKGAQPVYDKQGVLQVWEPISH